MARVDTPSCATELSEDVSQKESVKFLFESRAGKSVRNSAVFFDCKQSQKTDEDNSKSYQSVR